MPKPNKDGTYMNFKLENRVVNILNSYSEQTGIPKTRIVEDALSEHFKKLGIEVPDRSTKMQE